MGADACSPKEPSEIPHLSQADCFTGSVDGDEALLDLWSELDEAWSQEPVLFDDLVENICGISERCIFAQTERGLTFYVTHVGRK
ncbi:hypothetical protein G6F67_009695 [Rhizopus microsporus]|nr:hypothetical protein G6F67_009695 [Rhizopus microsporus]